MYPRVKHGKLRSIGQMSVFKASKSIIDTVFSSCGSVYNDNKLIIDTVSSAYDSVYKVNK